MEKASTALEVAVDTLKLLSGITENVPYLSIITDCVKRLIEIHKAVGDNETRASEVLNNILNVSHILAKGLCDLHDQDPTAASGLKNVLEKYQTFLTETCHIWEKRTSKSQFQPFAHAHFLGIADGIDRRLNAFRDASCLTDLSSSQDALTKNVSIHGGIGGPGGPGAGGGPGGIGEGPRVTVFRPQISNMTVHGAIRAKSWRSGFPQRKSPSANTTRHRSDTPTPAYGCLSVWNSWNGFMRGTPYSGLREYLGPGKRC
ncbi:hypothetical protein B0H14DRAFT_3001972 [Mycena olivaceomarginata]|nr:hypothetical protein B0H14DRAFT_3001972 [Mycena olivaceomarginata]